jgi:hypothetical protein
MPPHPSPDQRDRPAQAPHSHRARGRAIAYAYFYPSPPALAGGEVTVRGAAPQRCCCPAPLVLPYSHDDERDLCGTTPLTYASPPASAGGEGNS